jgi:hypothetical protein
MPPLSSGIHPRGDTSLHAINPSQPLRGCLRHLWLPAKHDEYSFRVIEVVGNQKTQLTGVAAGTLLENAKAQPQHLVDLRTWDSFSRMLRTSKYFKLPNFLAP